MTLRGISSARLERAVGEREPLPGTVGFAGRLPDGSVVRDVLGRQPVYTEAEDPATWSFDPADLDAPSLVPAGTVRSRDGDERVWRLPDPPVTASRRSAIAAVEAGIETAFDSLGSGGLAVAFSGGLDSALVASAVDAPLYVVGFPDSHDVAAAASAARMMGRELEVVALDRESLERAIPTVARETGRTNAMDVAIALPLYLVARRARADGYDRLAVGQGADELFGGYAKVAKAPTDPRLEADTVREAAREVVGTLPDQLERDVLAIRAAGMEPVAPLLHDRVVEAALRLPGDLLVDDRGERKLALRLAARERLPDRVAFREKKAVQYGSLVSRELDRLARQAGYKRRMDDHVSRYVASLI